MTNPVVKQRFTMHARLQGGSMMVYALIDEAGNEIGAMSHTTVRDRKTKRTTRTETMTLKLNNGELASFSNREDFFAAYRQLLEQRQRDAEWDAASKKEVKRCF